MFLQLRKSEMQYAKLRDLLRGVREELATRERSGVVPKEDFERLWQKYDRAKAKVRCTRLTTFGSTVQIC